MRPIGIELEPMLAHAVASPPEGPDWAFEIKWDGVRAFALALADGVRMVSRRGEDLTPRYPELAGIGAALAGHEAVLDGEIVALDEAGRPSFQRLQRRMGLSNPATIAARVAETPVSYVAFDALALDGEDLRERPYRDRRAALAGLSLDGPHWRAPAHHVGDGAELLALAAEQGLEGVVAKRLESPYVAGRDRRWQKVRLRLRQELVIGGWLAGAGGRSGRVGSLLVGYWDRTPAEAGAAGAGQRLVYAGAVGSGLTEAMIDSLTAALERIRLERSPFELGIGPKRPDPRWSEPLLVCEVEFSEWTREQTLRQPAFKGMRDDKDPREVIREPAMAATGPR